MCIRNAWRCAGVCLYVVVDFTATLAAFGLYSSPPEWNIGGLLKHVTTLPFMPGYSWTRSGLDFLELAILRLLLITIQAFRLWRHSSRNWAPTRSSVNEDRDLSSLDSNDSIAVAMKELWDATVQSASTMPIFIISSAALAYDFVKLLALLEHEEQSAYLGVWINFGWEVISLMVLFPIVWYCGLVARPDEDEPQRTDADDTEAGETASGEHLRDEGAQRSSLRQSLARIICFPIDCVASGFRCLCAAGWRRSGFVRMQEASAEPTSSENAAEDDTNWHVFKKVVRLYYPKDASAGETNRCYFTFYLILFALSALVDLGMPIVMGKVFTIDKSMGNFNYLLGLGALSLGKIVLDMSTSFLSSRSHAYVVHDMRRRVYRHTLRFDFAALSKEEATKAQVEAQRCLFLYSPSNVISHALRLVKSFLSTIGASLFMFYFSPRTTLLVFSLMPLLVTITLLHGSYSTVMSGKKRDEALDLCGYVDETFNSLKEVRSFGCENHEYGNFEARLRKLFAISMRESTTSTIYSIVRSASSYLTMMILLAYASHLIVHDQLQASQVFPLYLYYQIMRTDATECFNSYSNLMGEIVIARSILEHIKDESLTGAINMDKPGLDDAEPSSGPVNVLGISYAYNSSDGGVQQAIKDLKFNIPSGEHVALMGASGCGKSTFAQILARILHQNDGHITIGSRKHQDFRHQQFHEAVTIVHQESNFFSRSFRDNIAYGCSNVLDEDIESAARQAYIHDVIMTKGGYEQKYSNLSSGEKQRLAIARALVRKPKILILDEATSALPPALEAAILDKIFDVNRTATIISIAQKPSGTRGCSRIITLTPDNGKPEMGTEKELLQRQGEYYRLYRQQGDDEA